MPSGRPSDFQLTPEIIEDVLHRTEEGELITNVMRSHGTGHGTWDRACKADPELAARYAAAYKLHSDALAEGAVNIVEAEPEHTVVLNSKNEVLSSRVDTGYVAWQKLRFEARVKMLGFWAKDRYGDNKQQVDLGSAPGRALHIEDTRDPAAMALAIAAALRAKKRDGDPPEITEADIEDLI